MTVMGHSGDRDQPCDGIDDKEKRVLGLGRLELGAIAGFFICECHNRETQHAVGLFWCLRVPGSQRAASCKHLASASIRVQRVH